MEWRGSYTLLSKYNLEALQAPSLSVYLQQELARRVERVTKSCSV